MIRAIVAADKNWAIGKDNRLLISIPDDMRFFKDTTSGNVVIMGRKTLESFPQGKPLPNRENIVITRDLNYKRSDATVVHSPQEALKIAAEYKKDIYIICGGSIYEALIDSCDEALVTYIKYSYDADTYFPNLDKRPEWVLVGESEEQTHYDIIYFFRKYQRRPDYRP